MRRVMMVPRMNMIPVMGLCTMLIPMVLLASDPPVSIIETSLPSI